MSVPAARVRELARQLAEAEANGGWVPLLSERIDGFDMAAARAIARERDRLRLEDGDRRIGYKLGWTSVAMRNALGIEQPNWGTLWASQVEIGPLDTSRLHQPKVEPELVAEIGQDGVASRWCLGIEIVNPRFESYRFDQLDNTADNSSCARIRLGERADTVVDPGDVHVVFSDGEDTLEGSGAAVDGGPDAAIAWLAESLAAEGTELVPGEIVFSGGLTRPFDVVAGGSYRLRSTTHPDLGVIEVAAV